MKKRPEQRWEKKEQGGERRLGCIGPRSNLVGPYKPVVKVKGFK